MPLLYFFFYINELDINNSLYFFNVLRYFMSGNLPGENLFICVLDNTNRLFYSSIRSNLLSVITLNDDG
jgi:hypothetical protein